VQFEKAQGTLGLTRIGFDTAITTLKTTVAEDEDRQLSIPGGGMCHRPAKLVQDCNRRSGGIQEHGVEATPDGSVVKMLRKFFYFLGFNFFYFFWLQP
jgi:hypothetical protein